MARMTKAQARRRLIEAQSKFKKVYMSYGLQTIGVVSTKDMEAVDKIVTRCIKRLG